MGRILALVGLLSLVAGLELRAQPYYAAANADWSLASTWAASSGGAGGAGVPIAGDVVYIDQGFTVTVSGAAACASLQIGGTTLALGAGSGILNVTAGGSLIISGSVSVGGDGAATTGGRINFLAGGATITAGSLTLGSAAGTPGTPNTVDMSAGGTLSIGGTISVIAGPVNNWIPGTGTVIFTATNTLPTTVFTSFNNITFNGGTTTLGASISVSGNWSTLTIPGFDTSGNTVTFTSTGTQTLNSAGTSFNGITHSGVGTLQLVTSGLSTNGLFSNTAGIFDANGLDHTVTGLTIIGGGTYQALAAGDHTFSGGLIISGGAFSAATGTGSIATSGINISSGSFTGGLGSVTTTNVTLSNGTLTAPSGPFNVSGNWTRTGGTFTPGGNTVTFNGAALQTLNSGGQSFNSISNSGAGPLRLVTNGLISTGTFTNASGSFDANGLTHTVTGLTTISGGTYLASTSTQTFNGGLTVSGGIFTGSSGTVSTTNVTLSSGTLTAPSGLFTVSGNWTNNGGALGAGSGTVTFNGGVAQAIGGTASTSFNNVNILNASTNASIGFATTVSGNLSIGNGATITAAGFNLTIGGNTTVGGGASGSLVVSSATGTKLFTGLVTVASGGTWNNSGNSNITFRGGITSGGTFTAGSGLHTFDTNTQSLTGTLSIPSVTVSGITLINNNSLTVNTALSGAGDFTQATGSSLILGGATTISTLNAINSGNTVSYNGSAQTIKAATYNNLTVNQAAAATAILGGDTGVNGVLTLSSGNLNLSGNVLTIGATGTIPAPAAFILASGGGEVRKVVTGLGPFTFPIGDNTAVSSPIAVNITAGSFSSSYIGVSVVKAKHPNNASTTNFLNRYWNVTQSGIPGFVGTLTGTYDAGDVAGAAGSISSAHLIGTFNQASNPWTKHGVLAGTVSAPGVLLNSGQTGVITGITNAAPTVVIDLPVADVSICVGSSVGMNATPSGDGPFTYLWSSVPAAGGLSSTTIANPSATPTVTTDYTLTVTDGNGIVSAASNIRKITVGQLPNVVATPTSETICHNTSTGIALSTSNGVPMGGYFWTVVQNNVTGASDQGSVGAPIAGPIAQTLLASTVSSGTATYTITPVSAAGCVGSSINVIVTVNPTPSVTAPSNQVVCNGANTGAITFSGTGT
ncbi:MAG: PKD-like domain-containing protein, partial [Cytophagales bacterium]|nr:PKD-like domain-containing protein [Cytophagales bacterium]